MVREQVINDLLLSVASVITFLSVEHFLVSRGYTSVAGILLVVGVLLLTYSGKFYRAIPTQLINKKIIMALAHILIFVSLKIYLDAFLDDIWVVLFIVGIVLLNQSHTIAKFLAKK